MLYRSNGCILNGAFAADAGGVDDVITLPVTDEGRVDRIPRGAGKIRYHGALLPQNAVDQAGFADVGAPDNGDLNRVRFFFHAASLLGKVTDHFVKQIAQPQHVGRRDRKRLSQPQGIKIIDRIVHARMIHLVDNQDDGVCRFC